MQVTRTPGDSEDFVLDLFCDVRNSREIIILAREPWKIPEVSLMLLNEKQKMARDIRQAVGILAWRVCRPAAGEFVPCFRLVLEAALREHGHDRLLLNNLLWFAAGFASTDLLRVLVQAGARPDVIVHGHSTSLMTAITNGNRAAVELFCEFGVSVTAPAGALFLATIARRPEILTVLLAHLPDTWQHHLDESESIFRSALRDGCCKEVVLSWLEQQQQQKQQQRQLGSAADAKALQPEGLHRHVIVQIYNGLMPATKTSLEAFGEVLTRVGPPCAPDPLAHVCVTGDLMDLKLDIFFASSLLEIPPQVGQQMKGIFALWNYLPRMQDTEEKEDGEDEAPTWADTTLAGTTLADLEQDYVFAYAEQHTRRRSSYLVLSAAMNAMLARERAIMRRIISRTASRALAEKLLVKFIREARLSARGASADDSVLGDGKGEGEGEVPHLALAAAFHAGDEALVQILLHETEQQEGQPFSLRTSGLPIDLSPAFQAALLDAELPHKAGSTDNFNGVITALTAAGTGQSVPGAAVNFCAEADGPRLPVRMLEVAMVTTWAHVLWSVCFLARPVLLRVLVEDLGLPTTIMALRWDAPHGFRCQREHPLDVVVAGDECVGELDGAEETILTLVRCGWSSEGTVKVRDSRFAELVAAAEALKEVQVLLAKLDSAADSRRGTDADADAIYGGDGSGHGSMMMMGNMGMFDAEDAAALASAVEKVGRDLHLWRLMGADAARERAHMCLVLLHERAQAEQRQEARRHRRAFAPVDGAASTLKCYMR